LQQELSFEPLQLCLHDALTRGLDDTQGIVEHGAPFVEQACVATGFYDEYAKPRLHMLGTHGVHCGKSLAHLCHPLFRLLRG
jgi:hypothetical protein